MTQVQFTAWPDFGVVNSAKAILDLVEVIQELSGIAEGKEVWLEPTRAFARSLRHNIRLTESCNSVHFSLRPRVSTYQIDCKALTRVFMLHTQ